MESSAPPHIVILMGVSGSGKSTVAGMLVSTLGWDLLEGDDLHPPANIAKMAAGHALTDADREPWLHAIADWMSKEVSAGRSAIVTCSALKRSYRDILRAGMAGHPEAMLTFLHLTGSRDDLQRRLTARMDHFMPPGLLDSQLDTLEAPGPDEHIVGIPIGPPPREVAAAALAALRARR
ncbi:gluconokinase [Nocardia yunnanensis]|uniref:Gluconokinase n=1 Tax=Nocardia yunnanensis TaxID=2382165 RepID=A0A386ZHT3_9NOCA|nr:gluconokinase [Nocardia yunnanensis]AYF76950.1 gluconokinase [Nocardia yunnanensis]